VPDPTLTGEQSTLGQSRMVDQNENPHDVENGVDGADLVKVNLLRRRAVNGGLRLREQGESLCRLLTSSGRQFRGVQYLADVRETPVRVMLARLDVSLDSGDAGAGLAPHGDGVSVELYSAKQPFEAERAVEGCRHVGKRAEKHVPRYPGGGVEVYEPVRVFVHHSFSPLSRLASVPRVDLRQGLYIGPGKLVYNRSGSEM